MALEIPGKDGRQWDLVALGEVMLRLDPGDGRVATTTWWLGPFFRERFPRVELDDSRMIVESGRFATAGAALAHLDLALWLVRRRSPALATLTARYLILDARNAGSPSAAATTAS